MAKKRGRPAIHGAKMQPISVRLPPKTRFGLELLANANNTSLAGAIVWALDVAFHMEMIDADTPITSLLSELPDDAPQPLMYLILFRRAPNLIPIADRLAARAVWTSNEMGMISRGSASEASKERRQNELFQYAVDNWTVIQKLAAMPGAWKANNSLKVAVSDYLREHPAGG